MRLARLGQCPRSFCQFAVCTREIMFYVLQSEKVKIKLSLTVNPLTVLSTILPWD